jgi:hypothetical protein
MFNCYNGNQTNYYFDALNLIYMPCYSTCKECSEMGNETNHKCTKCNDNYYQREENCYENCTFFYYFDSLNQYFCTKEEKCPQHYKLIEEKRKCIDKCSNDNLYILEYNKKCYVSCPENTHNTSENICEDDISECDIDYLYINKNNNKCLKECSGEDFFNEICGIRLNDNAGKDEMILKIGNDIESGAMDSILENLTHGGGEDLIIEYKDISYQITSSSNQKNNENKNKSAVILSNCENILKGKIKTKV